MVQRSARTAGYSDLNIQFSQIYWSDMYTCGECFKELNKLQEKYLLITPPSFQLCLVSAGSTH